MNKLLEPINYFGKVSISFDDINGKIVGRLADKGICFSLKKPEYFFCPHCKTTNFDNVKEERIDGEPEIKSIAYGMGFADTKYGKSYVPIMDGDKSRDYPVSFKYFCENCRNEFTKPELMEALNERDKVFEKEKTNKIIAILKALNAKPYENIQNNRSE